MAEAVAEGPNAAQIEYWNSPERRHWIDNAHRYDEMLEGFSNRLLDAARLEPGDQVIDIGCGCGATTLAAAHRVPSGTAVGIDISEPMVAFARERALDARLANITFEVGDAQTLTFDSPADAVVSRFGVMFFEDPVAAFGNVRTALHAGGRLAFMCWQEIGRNPWMTVPFGAARAHVPAPPPPDPLAPGPYALADGDRVREILDRSGWSAVELEPVTTPMLVGGRGTVDDAVDFLRHTGMGHMLLGDDDAEASARATEAVRDAMAEHHNGVGVELDGAAWLVTARA
jgi:SAM-dependent methyltransferase